MNSADILDPSKLCFVGDFDTQVEDLMIHVRLTATEVRNLRNLFVDLEHALQNLKTGVRVLPFGSIVTGLGIKTSDVDCFIALPDGMNPNRNYVIHARNILRQYHKKFTNLFAITSAKVPIVKFLHIPTNRHCDINFKSPAGVHNSHLISFLLQLDPTDQSLKLAILIKYWSKVHKITGTNLLASYALTLMVVFYLQLMSVLPSIMDLQKTVPPYFIDYWNTAFDFDMMPVNNSESYSLYDLLGGFFKCYATMNFQENIISPYMGRLLNKNLFKNMHDIPSEFAVYKNNISNDVCQPLNIDTPFCVQDPFEHARNTAAGVYPKLAFRIKAHIQFAAKKFDELPPERFLKAIFMEDTTKDIPNVKRKIKHVYQNKVMKVKNNPPQRQNGVQNHGVQQHRVQNHRVKNNLNLIKCYEQIKAIKRPSNVKRDQ